MPTKKELAKEYAQRLRGKRDSSLHDEFAKILDDIEKLVYESNNEPLTKQFKVSLLNEIKKYLRKTRLVKKAEILDEAQESERFAQSLNAIEEYIKPAIDVIEAEVQTLNQEIEAEV